MLPQPGVGQVTAAVDAGTSNSGPCSGFSLAGDVSVKAGEEVLEDVTATAA